MGDNATGKTSILDAISFALLEYKGGSLELSDMNNIEEDTIIEVLAQKSCKYKGSMPKSEYTGQGFHFKASL